MKHYISLSLLSLSVGYGEAAKCLTGGYVLEFDGYCNVPNFVSSFKAAHEQTFIQSRCAHTMEDEIDIHLGLDGTSTITRKSAVRQICRKAWDSIKKIPFGDIAHDEDNENFEQLFYNGGTHWNEEVETNLESTDGSQSNHLRTDARQAKLFYQNWAQSAQVKWPDDLTNFSPDSCSMNAAYCCWPKDRQANDNNGNCAKPYDTNCFDKDPADNTDLCYNYAERGVKSTGHTGKTTMMYPGDNDGGEGAIHCHGFAWSNDPYDFTSRYKANNLFFVSMYDHLHQRGYVEETPGAPMCACAEQMPTATRSDCTQIDVDEKYRIRFSASPGEYTAELYDIEIDFNSCQGKNNRNNDLAAYVRRLVDEGKITADQRYALSEHLVENNNCPSAMKYHLESKHGITTGYAADEQWEFIVGKDAFDYYAVGNSLFSTLYEQAPEKIIHRVCATCAKSHQHIYYKRLTAIPDEYDLFNALKNKWESTHNVMGQDFELYSTLQDALDSKNEWQFCNYHSHVGMPYECGPTEKVHNQWAKMMWPGGKADVAFYIFKDDAKDFNRQALSGGQDIGVPKLSGDAYEIDGKSYITAAGNGIWHTSDEFYFLPKTTTADIKLKVHILSMAGPEWSKVGLMIRESLDVKSKNAACLFMNKKHGVVMQRRTETGSWTGSQGFNPESDSVWLQMEKQGNTYTCSWSVDGNDWSTGFTQTIDLGDGPQYGMAMTAHNWWYRADALYDNYSEESTGEVASGMLIGDVSVPRGRAFDGRGK